MAEPQLKGINVGQAGPVVRVLFIALVLIPATAGSTEFAIDGVLGPISAEAASASGSVRLSGQVSWLDKLPIAPTASLSLWRRTVNRTTHGGGSQTEYRLYFIAVDLGVGARGWSTEVSKLGLMGTVAPTLLVGRLSDYDAPPAPPASVSSPASVSWDSVGGMRFVGTFLLRTSPNAAFRLGLEYLLTAGRISNRKVALDGASFQVGFGWGLQ